MASTLSTTYVSALYSNLLGFSDPAGVTAWAGQIDAGTNPYNVANAFLDSYQETAFPVALLYQAAFDRLPDYAGFTYWLNNYKTVSSGNPFLLTQQFYNSAEFATKVGGDPTTLAEQVYVEALYQNVLGRPGDFNGESYWINWLNAREAALGGTDAAKDTARTELLQVFAQSTENVSNNGHDIQTYTAYAAFDGRAPTGAELTAAAAQAEIQTVTDVVSTSPNYGATGDAPVPVFPLSIGSDVSTVQEGNTVTFTVTLNTPALTDETYTFNINGATSNGISTAATAADFVTGNHTFHVAAGETTGTFTVTALSDGVSEPLEGFKVSVLDSDLNTWTTSSILAIEDSTGGGTGQTYVLTTGIDNIPGTPDADTIVGNDSTLSAADVINGSGGTDTFKFFNDDAGGFFINNYLFTPSLTSVEKIISQITDDTTIDLASATGVQELWFSNSTDDLEYRNVAALATVGVIGGTNSADEYEVGFNAGLVDSSKTLDVVVKDVVDPLDDLHLHLNIGGQDGGNFGTWSITTTGSAASSLGGLYDWNGNAITASKVVFLGDQQLTVFDDIDNVTTFDASGSTGGARVVIDDTKNVTFTGGSGADRVDVGNTGLTFADKLDGGAGTADTFRISDGAMFTAANVANVKNFEIFEAIGNGAQTYDLQILAANNTLNEVRLTLDGDDVTINNIPDTALGAIRVVDDAGTVTLTGQSFVSGGLGDTATLILDNSWSLKDPLAEAGQTIDVLNFANVDLLNIQSISDGSPTKSLAGAEVNTISDLNAPDLNKIVVTGDEATNIVLNTATVTLTEVDASGLTGKAAFGFDSGNAAITELLVKGGIGSDTITVDNTATKATIWTGGGSDTVTLEATAADALKFAATAFNSGDVKGGDQISVTGAAAGSLTIGFSTTFDGLLTANGANLGTTLANQTLGDTFNGNNNVIAVDDGTDTYIQIDMNGNGIYDATNDHQIKLAGVTGSDIVYNAATDVFTIV